MESTGRTEFEQTHLHGRIRFRRLLPTLLLTLLVLAFAAPAQASGFCGDGHIEDPEECDDGNTDSGDGCSATCLTECAPGSVGTGGLTPCTLCQAGEFANDFAQQACVECAVGTAQSLEGQTACDPCTDGVSFSDMTGATMCRSCTSDCIPGYYLDGVCTVSSDAVCRKCRAVANCDVESCTDSIDSACVQCSAGFTLVNGACVAQAAQGACCTDGAGTQTECIVTSQADCENSGNGDPGVAPLYLGDNTTCGAVDCVLLLVTYETVEGLAAKGGVQIRWTTAMEVDTIGFRLLRERKTDTGEKVRDVVVAMIPAAGHGLTGATYQYVDRSKAAVAAEAYFLEDIDIYGKVSTYGPIIVRRGAGNATERNSRREVRARN